MITSNWTIRSLVTGLEEDVRLIFAVRIRAVYEDARRMPDDVVQHVFDCEFCERVAREFPSQSFAEQATALQVPFFDVISAYSDYLMNASVEDLTFDPDIPAAVAQLHITRCDVLDFALRIAEEEKTLVITLFEEDVWLPSQILLFCSILRLGLLDVRLIDRLDACWETVEYKRAEQESWDEMVERTEDSLARPRPLVSPFSQPIEMVDRHLEQELLPLCEEIRENLQLNTDTVRTSAKMFLDELKQVEIGPPSVEVPELELVGDEQYENMSVFKKMCDYQLHDLLEIGFEKRMNVSKHDELIVELDDEFVHASFASWVHDEEGLMNVYVQNNGLRRCVRQVPTEKVAIGVNPGVMCGAGTRVLAEYHENYGQGPPKVAYWAWGTLGTFPIKEYKYHYLVFFDNGAVRFVRPPNIRLCVLQPNDPDEDRFNPIYAFKHVKGVRQDFLREYFKVYPAWPLMKIDPETTAANLKVVRDMTKKKPKTGTAIVLKKDRCLLLVRFLKDDETEGKCCEVRCSEHDHKDEWIFAGDCQRIPALKNIVPETENPRDVDDFPEQFRPYIQMLYPKYEEDGREFDDDYLLLNQFKLKNTARKKFTKKEVAFSDFFNNARNMRIQFSGSHQQNSKFKRRRLHDRLTEEWLEFPDWSGLPKAPHAECGPSCLKGIQQKHLLYERAYKNCSPLFRPFLFGFTRSVVALMCGEIPVFQQMKRELTDEVLYVYEAPCGRLLRNHADVAYYLHTTHCDQVSVEQFTFRAWERVNLVYLSDSKALVSTDYSNAKEAVDIPAVNSVDTEGAPLMIYQNGRSMDEPLLERQMEFLSCCSCIDDCMDSSKCECQMLTAETHQRLDSRIRQDTPEGYVFRRLENKLFAGIYECNSLCGCRRSCVNRIVQRDISIPMQMFKTENKGWGVRTLVDLPAGVFVSTYSGKMYTDVKADEYVRSGDGNDLYFADVDLFDSVENMKRSLNIPCEDEGIDVADQQPRRGRKKKPKKDAPKRPSGQVGRPKLSLLRRLFHEESLFVVDAQDRGNIGRFFNHSCDPNLETQMIFHETHDLRLPLIAFFTLCDVEAGTELCWNYGYVAGSVSGKAIDCCCGSATCVGRIL